MHYLIDVVVPFPKHTHLPAVLTWTHSEPLDLGSLVRVPLGQRELLGVVWQCREDDAAPRGSDAEDGTPRNAIQLRPISGVHRAVAPLGRAWREVVQFCAQYYQRNLGEVVHIALPPALRELEPVQLERSMARLHKQQQKRQQATQKESHIAPQIAPLPMQAWPPLSPDQATVLTQLSASRGDPLVAPTCSLLFGVTGSGKTEVYMRWVAAHLQAQPQAQALILVPEINLTPQLQGRFEQRFGAEAVVVMHSGVSPMQRLHAWLQAHSGAARIVLGTRLAVLASMPNLALIVVDEEHDPSYKSQDGARHSARDLAVWRGKREQVPVVLGSATPSLESWYAVQQGRYQLLPMQTRIGQGQLPPLKMVDMRLEAKDCILSTALKAAIAARVARGEQSLLFLNRRGYAPVLHCSACDWKSDCPHCSAYRVFHKIDRSLRCHHCGLHTRVPRACPDCGNLDIVALGRGTERIEELLPQLLEEIRQPNGEPLRVLRIDADTSRHKGALEEQLAQVHDGSVDVIIGTQMVTKGHDFRRITLVAALNPDGALFNIDFRAPERLFALLMQAGGRAGRDAQFAAHSELWVQTHVPDHSVFTALAQHDYPRFAQAQLRERAEAAMPPYCFQALLRAEARTQAQAQDFLSQMRQAALALLAHIPEGDRVVVYAPVPMTVQKIANIERAQMLLECDKRPILQAFLRQWQDALAACHVTGLLRWAIDVDPQGI